MTETDPCVRDVMIFRRWLEIMHRELEMYSDEIAEVLNGGERVSYLDPDDAGFTSVDVLVLFETLDIKRLHTDVHDPRKPEATREESALDW